MFLRMAPIEGIIRIAAGLGDQDGPTIGRGLDVSVLYLGRVEDVGAVVAQLIDERIRCVFLLGRDGDVLLHVGVGRVGHCARCQTENGILKAKRRKKQTDAVVE